MGTVLEVKYPFCKDNIFLVARLDHKFGHEQVLLQVVNPTTKEVIKEHLIECMQPAI